MASRFCVMSFAKRWLNCVVSSFARLYSASGKGDGRRVIGVDCSECDAA